MQRVRVADRATVLCRQWTVSVVQCRLCALSADSLRAAQCKLRAENCHSLMQLLPLCNFSSGNSCPIFPDFRPGQSSNCQPKTASGQRQSPTANSTFGAHSSPPIGNQHSRRAAPN